LRIAISFTGNARHIYLRSAHLKTVSHAGPHIVSQLQKKVKQQGHSSPLNSHTVALMTEITRHIDRTADLIYDGSSLIWLYFIRISPTTF